MCGILSSYSYHKPLQHELHTNALKTLSHRGPDSQKLWFSNNQAVALGHTRLSVIDLETGAQPFHNEDNSIHIVVNGEFYDYKTIREDLIRKGHVFRSNSDSEIALHLYEEYDLEFMRFLRGEFAFVLYDERQDRIVAARDRFGIKPLHYVQNGNGITISSEAKAILALGHAAKFDELALFHSMQTQYLPSDRSYFDGIWQIPPGSLFIHHDRSIKIVKYWDQDYPVEMISSKSEQDLIDTLKEKLVEAVTLRLQSDVPVCFMLSGGLDSSSIVRLAADARSEPIHCFSVSFEDQNYDELELAKLTADQIGAQLHSLQVTENDVCDHLSQAVYFSEGTAINGHLAAKYLLSREIQKYGFKVVLSGEGADEVLCGYPHFKEDIFAANHNTQGWQNQLYESNQVTSGIMLKSGEELTLQAIERRLHFIPSFLHAKASLGFRMSEFLSVNFKDQFKHYDGFEQLLRNVDVSAQLTNRHVVNQSSYLWSKNALANSILKTLGDGTEMAHSVEGRMPFLDHILFEFCKTLPVNLKIKGQTEKYILREAMKKFLPDRVIKKQKHPFYAPPLSHGLKGHVLDFVRDTLHSAYFLNLGYFDAKAVHQHLNKISAMSRDEQTRYDPILMLILTTTLLGKNYAL